VTPAAPLAEVEALVVPESASMWAALVLVKSLL